MEEISQQITPTKNICFCHPEYLYQSYQIVKTAKETGGPQTTRSNVLFCLEAQLSVTLHCGVLMKLPFGTLGRHIHSILKTQTHNNTSIDGAIPKIENDCNKGLK